MKYFNNPISETTKPDPFILQVNGKYYCYSTHRDGVKVSVSDDLINFEDKGFALTCEEEIDFWAPSALYYNGVYYLYYSSVSKNKNDTLEESLKVATSDNPLGPFNFEKRFFNFFSIDSQPYFYNGELYLFYSTNVMGSDDNMPGTCILVDKMKNPLEFEGKPKIVVKPSISEEIFNKNRFGDNRDWYTIEGASIIERNGKLYILYSANCYLNENYFINYSVGDLKEDLRDIEFEKYPDNYTYHSLMKKNDLVSGTGHNSVCKGPDLIEDFIVYHGRNNDIEFEKDKEQRTMRVDRLFFDGDELLCNGPSLKNIKSPNPSKINKKNLILNNQSIKMDVNENYIFDLWIKGIASHSGIRYGFIIGDYLEFELLEGFDKIYVYKVNNLVRRKIQEIDLNHDYNHQVSHCFKIKKMFNSVVLELEDNRKFKFDLALSQNLEVYSLYSSVEIISFSLNEYNCFEKDDLINLGNYFTLNKKLELHDNCINAVKDLKMSPKFNGVYTITVKPLSKASFIKVGDSKIQISETKDISFEINDISKFEIVLTNVRIKKFIYKKLQ